MAIKKPNAEPDAQNHPEKDHPEKDAAKVGSILVRGPAGGRRRAGRLFDAAPVEIPLADLKSQDEAAIRSDPFLSVKDQY